MQPLESEQHLVEMLLAIDEHGIFQPLAQFRHARVQLGGKTGHGLLAFQEVPECGGAHRKHLDGAVVLVAVVLCQTGEFPLATSEIRLDPLLDVLVAQRNAAELFTTLEGRQGAVELDRVLGEILSQSKKLDSLL
jgi:hypothetical protein